MIMAVGVCNGLRGLRQSLNLSAELGDNRHAEGATEGDFSTSKCSVAEDPSGSITQLTCLFVPRSEVDNSDRDHLQL
jgi:hypothetical protein